ncbi:U2 snRNP complex subunit CUS1 [Aspergillus homomorphus CBS 101889]|uniref:Splicing factor 3b, subunit 2 n=1 Tax=Aspergillus homomorphus (strain CBS 101889) TaxID=1450537 RepID=A0A395HGK8_ASPHC|nr:splicing factor 3b, subunit 2 [Aspergillus homomorphus CBS 101889]RAL06977.1 splicing factor 3b, subunit 2 [Aspergillus homomorphus CBS 101889]
MKANKNQLRRAKRKALKSSKANSIETTSETPNAHFSDNNVLSPPAPEAVPQKLQDIVTPENDNALWQMYKDVIDKFDNSGNTPLATQEPTKPVVYFDEDNEIPDEEEKEPVLSRRKRKELNKLSVAELKAMVRKPEIVEWTDTSAPDPRLLVHLKSYRNVVPVPSHWSLKREYLSSKRGVEKAPFALPKFIQETGISEMRDAALEKQEQATLKQKQRERVQPKMGRLDIDYQKLYEAFFRFQTKPELTRYGEVYYEGKEYETNLRHLRPGELSAELKEALNMPPGAPPPWLINQQRYGPPPSYPALKIPGLNAPPPPGAMWGYHPGGYGKPPVDEHNRPLYGGDIFGVLQPQQVVQQGEPVEKDLWGELQAPELSDDESEEGEDDAASSAATDDDDDDVDTGLQTPSGLETPSGLASAVPTETSGPENISGEFDVRKHYRGTQTEESTGQRSAFQVIPERQAHVQGFFGADKVYDLHKTSDDLPVLGSEDANRKRKKPGDVDVSFDPDALQSEEGIGQGDIRKMYESQKQRETDPSWDFQEDLSDMIARESRKRLRKEEERRKR